MILLLVLALADPLPVPDEQPLPDERYEELESVERVSLRDERYRLAIGISVSAGVFAWEDERQVGAATFSVDLHADFGRIALVLSPHATVHVNFDIAGFFGFEGQLVFAIAEHLAVGVGTEQVVSVSRYQTGALRFGPSLRPFIARFGMHRFSLQIVWLAAAVQERSWPTCAECNARPMPYYTLGYGVVF